MKYSDYIEEAYEAWEHALLYLKSSSIFDAKQDLVQRIKEEYDDPTKRSKIHDDLLDRAVEALDRQADGKENNNE